jgi:hypothetical protein
MQRLSAITCVLLAATIAERVIEFEDRNLTALLYRQSSGGLSTSKSRPRESAGREAPRELKSNDEHHFFERRRLHFIFLCPSLVQHFNFFRSIPSYHHRFVQ